MDLTDLNHPLPRAPSISFLAHLKEIELASQSHGRSLNADPILKQPDGRSEFWANLPLLSGNSIWRDNADGSQIPFNLNSSPEKVAMAGVNGAMPFPSTPLLQDIGRRQKVSFQHDTPPGPSQVNQTMPREDHASPLPQNIASCSGMIGTSKVIMDDVMPFRAANIEDPGGNEGQGIDLNKTPKPKQRRKKHRPRVVVEVKKARTPKPKTPKPVTPKPARDSENPRVKRKYVRKKHLNPPDAPADLVQDTGIKKLSAKRKLNFDCGQDKYESHSSTVPCNVEPQERHAFGGGGRGNDSTVGVKERLEMAVENPPVSLMFDLNMTAANQALGEYICFSQETSDYLQTPLNAETNTGVMINYGGNTGISTPPSGRISSASIQPSRRESISCNINNLIRNNSILFPELDGSLSDLLPVSSKRNYSPTDDPCASTHSASMNVQDLPGELLPEIPGHTHPSRRELLRDNVKNLVSMRSSSLNFPNLGIYHSNTQMNGSNRDHGGVNNTNISAQIRSSYLLNKLGQSNERYFPRHVPYLSDPRKKRRIESLIQHGAGGSLEASSSAILDPFSRNNTQQTVSSRSKVFTFADAERLLAQEKMHVSRGTSLIGQSEKLVGNRPVGLLRESSASETLNSMQIGMPEKSCRVMELSCSQTPTIITSGSANHIQENRAQGFPSCIDSVVADSFENVMSNPDRKKRKERNKVTNPSPKTLTRGRKPSKKKDSVYLHIDCIEDSHSSSAIKDRSNAKSIGPGAKLCRVSLEEITQFLSQLDINKDRSDIAPEAQNTLAVYNGVNIVVPYVDISDVLKKRRLRVKVDLDPETQRMWKLLMENGSVDMDDETSKEKEKWWEEERRVFRGRTDSFIARMHLVQGDRRFSPWKGSVVDSVVGVFLTQNVSDHLSSSAFMALAARYPFCSSDKQETNAEKCETSLHHQAGSSITSIDSTLPVRKPCEHVSKEVFVDEAPIEGVALAKSTIEGENPHTKSPDNGDQESLGSRTDTPCTVTGSTSNSEADDRRSSEDVISSQGSAILSQCSTEHLLQTAYQERSSFKRSFENDLMTETIYDMDISTSFTKLLEIASRGMPSEEFTNGIDQAAFSDGRETVGSSQLSHLEYQMTHVPQNSLCDVQESGVPFTYYSYNSSNSASFEMQYADGIQNAENSYLLPQADISETVKPLVGVHELSVKSMAKAAGQPYSSPSSTNAPLSESSTTVSKQDVNSSSLSQLDTSPGKDSSVFNSISAEKIEPLLRGGIRELHLQSQQVFQEKCTRNERVVDSCKMDTYHVVEAEAQVPRCEVHQPVIMCENLEQPSRFAEFATNRKADAKSSQTMGPETESKASKVKNAKTQTKNDPPVDWDSLRREVLSNHRGKERNVDTMDSLDWEAVRQADLNEIATTIRERGMNYMLAGRIKAFLDRLVKDHGSIDLEWLRDAQPDKVKEYLLSVRGLGLKSVECVRLLTLHHLAFPVDTNVGRICVRLGWVPLQPLPESLQLHLLELYPVLETIQKYLWPRLCILDQRTLYELHYQLITFGKVFCTKSKPNCNACPMRGECKHFASAFANARFALPPTEERNIVTSSSPATSHCSSNAVPNLNPPAQLEGSVIFPEGEVSPTKCGSIIKVVEEPIGEELVNEEAVIGEPLTEEPATPEELEDKYMHDIEDAFWKVDSDEIPTIKLNIEAFTQNVQSYMQTNNMELQDGEVSKALVLISEEAASIPMPKLKNVSRLRTEHQVYELPEFHPLLEGLDPREPDDPCPYLLAIWTPVADEIAQATEPRRNCCNFEAGGLCDQQTCFSCNGKREAESQTIRGTLLIPCRTAMRGSFPLNGTYFQVNEVFADHDSSHNPINVPRNWLWNLPRRTVYFGTTIPTIFRGLTTEGIQHCFWRGFVCVRGFHRPSRSPKPLYSGLHFPASKSTRNKRASKAKQPPEQEHQ